MSFFLRSSTKPTTKTLTTQLATATTTIETLQSELTHKSSILTTITHLSETLLKQLSLLDQAFETSNGNIEKLKGEIKWLVDELEMREEWTDKTIEELKGEVEALKKEKEGGKARGSKKGKELGK